MADLTPAYKGVDPASVVRALKGDKLKPLEPMPPEADYGIGNEFHRYAPGSPNDVNMDKTGTVKPNYRTYPDAIYPPVPPHDWMHDKIGQGMFGVPQQRLQQMAGDVVPFPKFLIEQDQQRSKGPDWPLSNVKPFDPKGDMTGGGKVIPLPLPNVLSGLTPAG